LSPPLEPLGASRKPFKEGTTGKTCRGGAGALMVSDLGFFHAITQILDVQGSGETVRVEGKSLVAY